MDEDVYQEEMRVRNNETADDMVVQVCGLRENLRSVSVSIVGLGFDTPRPITGEEEIVEGLSVAARVGEDVVEIQCDQEIQHEVNHQKDVNLNKREGTSIVQYIRSRET